MFSTFLLIVSIVGRVLPYEYQYQDYDSDWDYSLGDDWDVSNNIAASNPYYNTWQHLSAQMVQHAFAQHMGNIYRGQLTNPEINWPGHRAFGYDSDFNNGDFAYESGAFEYKSKGQRVVATQHNPCNPNPCSEYEHHHECVAVNEHTAKCSPCGDYQLVLSWTGAAGKTALYYLIMVPEKKKDGTLCSNEGGVGVIVSSYLSENGCGAVPGAADFVDGADFTNGKTASTTHTLTTSAVSPDTPPITSSYHDNIYQIFLFVSSEIPANNVLNPDEATPVLTVKYKGVQVATHAVPQGANDMGHYSYFFGCFVPQSNTCGGGYINQGGSGYYNTFSGSDFVTGELVLGDIGLCSATRKLE